jgi:hypothetical protein
MSNVKQRLLVEIVDELHDDARNYSVFLQAYEVASPSSADSLTIIRNALGNQATLCSIEEVPEGSLCSEVENALFYAGDDSAGPGHSVLGSAHFKKLIAELKADLVALADAASKIERFRLKHGHPAYPVFWDFAFLVRLDVKAIVFVGSSSD